jgi:N-acyl homoserine lactone hydrolase
VLSIQRLHLASLRGDIPVHGFVVSDGSTAALVDTGVGGPQHVLDDWRVVNRSVADALGDIGMSPADITLVVNTHLHFDHCGQNAVFKHAPFYIQRSELERARRQEKVTAEWFDFAGARFELMDGDAQVAEGVRVVATPGHTVGHQSVIVDTPDGGAIMIGDAAYTSDIYRAGAKADLSQWRGQYADRDAWAGSLEKLRAMHQHAVHFCHDTRVVEVKQ